MPFERPLPPRLPAIAATLALALLGACMSDEPRTSGPDVPAVERDAAPPDADLHPPQPPPDAATGPDLAHDLTAPDAPTDLDAPDQAPPDATTDPGRPDQPPPDATTDPGQPDTALCGNAVVDPGETCDIAIPSGQPGACPESCSSSDPCRLSELTGGGTCTAACSDTLITEPGPADGCCPPEGNANNDPDCDPVCGNGVIEEGEECDDGPHLPTPECDENCELQPVPVDPFRLDRLAVRTPHFFAETAFGCSDVTAVVNTSLLEAVSQDSDGDGFYDMSLLIAFRPLDPALTHANLDVAKGQCSTGDDPPACTFDPGVDPQRTAYANLAEGTCLAPEASTFNPDYSPAPEEVTAETEPCFVTETFSLVLEFGGLVVPLEGATTAANYLGSPPTSLENGLLRAFLSEKDADAIIIPEDAPVVGGDPLSTILPGEQDCSDNDDRVRDGPPDGDTVGWWFYLAYTAEPAELIE